MNAWDWASQILVRHGYLEPVKYDSAEMHIYRLCQIIERLENINILTDVLAKETSHARSDSKI